MSSCLPCTDPIPPCACNKGQSCVQTVRTCSQCVQNVCVNNSNASKGSGINTGVTVGGALGGVAGVTIALALLYFFWWKPRGLAASRKRYSRHLEARQSKRMSQLQTGNNKNAAKRTSVHLPMDADTLSNRHSRHANLSDDDHAPSSTGASYGGSNMLPRIRESIDSSDNPFSDAVRNSMATIPDGASEFSFRSSRSTNIIPIAYIPPHSNSISLDDAQRDAYGELPSPDQPDLPVSRPAQRASVPASMASRDSLVINGADLIDLHPLPAALSADSLKVAAPSSSASSSAPSAPTRPPRAPGLDLSLPNKRTSVTSPLGAQTFAGARPLSGFQTLNTTASSTEKPQLAIYSKFASSSSSSPTSATSPASGGEKSSPRTLAAQNAAQSHLSIMSTMTTSSSRSGSSTMSYILDPPQIITPVNPQGVRRVEMRGHGQAGLVRLPTTTGSAGLSRAAVAPVDDPFGDGHSILLDHRPGSTRRLTTSSIPTSAHDSVISLPATSSLDDGAGGDMSRWSDFTSTLSTGSRQTVQSTQADGTRLSSTPSLAAPSLTTRDSVRRSFESATTESASLLDDIPFMPPSSASEAHDDAPSSRPVSSSTDVANDDASSVMNERISIGPSDENNDIDRPDSPDALPSIEQIQQSDLNRPGSTAMSIRSGFGSGLSQIPFQLGFPSGLDSDNRSSMGAASGIDGAEDDNRHLSLMSSGPAGPSSNRGSTASSMSIPAMIAPPPSSHASAAQRQSSYSKRDTLANVQEEEEATSARSSWNSVTTTDEDDDDEFEVAQATRHHKATPSVGTLKAFAVSSSSAEGADKEQTQGDDERATAGQSERENDDGDDEEDPFKDQ